MKSLSSFRIGGEAKWFKETGEIDALAESVRWAQQHKLPIFILGGGTNILWSDKGFDGLVLRPAIKIFEERGLEVMVGAGVLMSDLLDFVIYKGFSGLEWAGGLPGTLGGAIRGNAGAFSGEIKNIVREVWSLDTKTLKIRRRSNDECGFGYRMSIFKKSSGQEIILRATLEFKPGDKKSISESIEQKIIYRQSRHPIDYPSAGSIFKNVNAGDVKKESIEVFKGIIKTDPVPVVPAAPLIDKAGLKGISCGGAMISPKHPNFIVNVLDAKAKDVKNLINLAKSEVFSKFSIKLEEEISMPS